MCPRYFEISFCLNHKKSLQAKFSFAEIFDSDIWCWKLWKLFIFLSHRTNIFVDKKYLFNPTFWIWLLNSQWESLWSASESLKNHHHISLSLSLSCHYHLEADEDAACDADDEDETQDDEGGHDDQDHQAVILLRRAEESHIHGSLKY